MALPALKNASFRVADLPQRRPTSFELHPDAALCATLAQELGLSALRKLSFTGKITPKGRENWLLHGTLGATVVQPCSTTLVPVTTRINETVQRRYIRAEQFEPDNDIDESEMVEDDSLEPLSDVIEPYTVMIESLSLAIPAYPRAPDADLGEAVFTEPGQVAMRDEDTKPFAGLAALRDKLEKDDE